MPNEGFFEPCWIPIEPESRIKSQWCAPPEDWEEAPSDEPRFRVMRVPTSDDGEVKEAVVPKRSLASLLENFTRGDVYTVLVNRVPTDDATEHTVLEGMP